MQKLKEAEEAPIADDYADLSFSHLHGWLNRTPQFLMYVYKVKTCQRSICYLPKKPCPFLHDGEMGRRDLLNHRHSCVPCLEFKNGFCPQFRWWLWPSTWNFRRNVSSYAVSDPVLLVHAWLHVRDRIVPMPTRKKTKGLQQSLHLCFLSDH